MAIPLLSLRDLVACKKGENLPTVYITTNVFKKFVLRTCNSFQNAK
jgi:hypothetical protein